MATQKVKKEIKKPLYKDEETRKRIHKHLQDKTDVITEDDLRNVQTDKLIQPSNPLYEPTSLGFVPHNF